MHRLTSALAALALVAFAASTASAQLNQPTKGKSWKTNVQTAYEECTAPDTVTDSGLPACSNPVMVDPDCGFAQSRGLAKIQLKGGSIGNTAYRIKFNKLEPSCEGNQLNFAVVARRSGQHCEDDLGSPGDCTVPDFTQQFANCIVTNGGCKASGHFTLSGGAETGQVEILDIVITNQTHGDLRAFRLGIINGKIIR